MIKWAGWLMVGYGSAHTLGAFTVEGAWRHVGAWFGGELWHDDLSDMSPANSALWLSLASFGPTLVLIGLLVVWLDRRAIAPPSFIGWTVGGLAALDAVIAPFTPWPILLFANILLLVGIRRAGTDVPGWSRGESLSIGSQHAGSTSTTVSVVRLMVLSWSGYLQGVVDYAAVGWDAGGAGDGARVVVMDGGG